MRNVERILRDEMASVGAQEFHLATLHPAEAWRASGRWDTVDETMFRLHDRRGGDYCLALTHEEIFTAIAANELQSYRQLPQRWYQIGLKFRDEPRPKGGLLRVREFHMKDAYSFDHDAIGLDRAFEDMRAAYKRIFARCGVDALGAEAFSGAMGGHTSIEFVVATPAGEDQVLHCAACGYVANLEVARSRVVPVVDTPDSENSRVFATPGVVTIEALTAAPYNVAAVQQLKTLVYVADDAPVVAVVRGDHTLNEAKLQVASDATRVRPAQPDEIFRLMGAHPGSLGAANFDACTVLVDATLADRTNMVTGANRDGFHLAGVNVRRDLLTGPHARVADLRTAAAGDDCPRCDGALDSFTALEVGHIFKLGTRYSEPLDARVLDANGDRVPLVMGSYGIGVERLLAAVVEQHHDDDGILWPLSVAPFAATVLTLGQEPELARVADTVTAALDAARVETLYDDRDERAGVKFKDADLIGIPLRIAVGRRGLASGTVEWKLRAQREVEDVPIEDVARRAAALLRPPAGSTLGR